MQIPPNNPYGYRKPTFGMIPHPHTRPLSPWSQRHLNTVPLQDLYTGQPFLDAVTTATLNSNRQDPTTRNLYIDPRGYNGDYTEADVTAYMNQIAPNRHAPAHSSQPSYPSTSFIPQAGGPSSSYQAPRYPAMPQPPLNPFAQHHPQPSSSSVPPMQYAPPPGHYGHPHLSQNPFARAHSGYGQRLLNGLVLSNGRLRPAGQKQ